MTRISILTILLLAIAGCVDRHENHDAAVPKSRGGQMGVIDNIKAQKWVSGKTEDSATIYLDCTTGLPIDTGRKVSPSDSSDMIFVSVKLGNFDPQPYNYKSRTVPIDMESRIKKYGWSPSTDKTKELLVFQGMDDSIVYSNGVGVKARNGTSSFWAQYSSNGLSVDYVYFAKTDSDHLRANELVVKFITSMSQPGDQ